MNASHVVGNAFAEEVDIRGAAARVCAGHVGHGRRRPER
jgi:hypothetical protein